MTILLKQVEGVEVETLFPILLLAEQSIDTLHRSLNNLSDTIYRIEAAGQIVGAAAMRWHGEPCEIVDLAVVEHRQGQGLGRQIVEELLAAARRRGKDKMIVGTGNSSIENIVFYQKCGFRMDHVRRDYFWHHHEPEWENGIRLRDMIVLSYDLPAENFSLRSPP